MTLAAGIDVGTGAVKVAVFSVDDGEERQLALISDRIRRRDASAVDIDVDVDGVGDVDDVDDVDDAPGGAHTVYSAEKASVGRAPHAAGNEGAAHDARPAGHAKDRANMQSSASAAAPGCTAPKPPPSG